MLSDPFFMKSVLYGIEDSLISTSGVVIGMHFAHIPQAHIVVAGIVLVIVEALSMSYGTYISDQGFFRTVATKKSVADLFPYALVMLLSYVAAGAVIVAPFYLKAQNPSQIASILAILGLLAVAIFVEGDAIKAMVLTAIGASIIAVSVYVGKKLEV